MISLAYLYKSFLRGMKKRNLNNLVTGCIIAFLVCFGIPRATVGQGYDVEDDSLSKDNRYRVWLEDKWVEFSYTGDFSNPNKKDLVVWAIPEETRIKEGSSILIDVYFRNTTERIVFLPYSNQWNVTIQGERGFSRQGGDLPLPARRKIEPGKTVKEEIILRNASLGGEFVDVALSWGGYEIEFDRFYLQRILEPNS